MVMVRSWVSARNRDREDRERVCERDKKRDRERGGGGRSHKCNVRMEKRVNAGCGYARRLTKCDRCREGKQVNHT